MDSYEICLRAVIVIGEAVSDRDGLAPKLTMGLKRDPYRLTITSVIHWLTRKRVVSYASMHC